MRKIIGLMVLVLLSFGSQPITAQDDAPPYLYYYSRMLGGIIIERADGTDSRLIGADVIPRDMTGIGGPGWSPSGKFFAAYAYHYDAYTPSTGSAFVMDNQGNASVQLLPSRTVFMQWAPDGSDLLLVVGAATAYPPPQTPYFFWLVDPVAKQIVAEFAVNLERSGNPFVFYGLNWDVAARHIVFYISVPTDIPTQSNKYRVTMYLDGTLLKDAITEGFVAQPALPEIPEIDYASRNDKLSTSPSGRYFAYGRQLQDLQAGTEIIIPRHSRNTFCQELHWNADEQFIITMGGTLIAGGGCAPAVLGVTDSQGQLWRELGGCSWDTPPCVGWLPDQVDVADLPPGQAQPIQLAPVAYEQIAGREQQLNFWEVYFQFHCADGNGSNRNIVEIATEEIKFSLKDQLRCPYNEGDSFSEEGLPLMVAYNADHQLLATFIDYMSDKFVSVWKICPDGVGIRILRLDSYAYQLEFSPDGQQLRAKNYNAWKIYDVDDILAAATADCEAAS